MKKNLLKLYEFLNTLGTIQMSKEKKSMLVFEPGYYDQQRLQKLTSDCSLDSMLSKTSEGTPMLIIGKFDRAEVSQDAFLEHFTN